MTSDRALSAELASAVADGEAVDWDMVQRRTPDPDSERAVSNLRLVAEIAARNNIPAAASGHRFDVASVGAWRWILMAAAGFQTAAGLIGATFGAPDGRPLPVAPLVAASLAFGLAAGLLLLGGRHDRRAIFLAGFFLMNASAIAHRFLAWLMPGAWFAVALHPEAFLPAFLWSFAREFPRVLRLGRADALTAAGVRTSTAIGLVLFSANLIAEGIRPGHAVEVPWLGVLTRDHPLDIYWTILALATVPALALLPLRSREAPEAEKRRVKWFLLGLAVGFGPLFFELLLEALVPPFGRLMRRQGPEAVGAVVLYAFLLSVPFITAYAVVARRVLDVRIVVRRATRYALARTTLVVLAVGPLPALGWTFYVERHSPFVDVLSGPRASWLLGATLTAGLALALRPWLARRLERTFFRGATDWREALVRLSAEAAAARSTLQIQDCLACHLDGPLRPEHVTLLVRTTSGAWLVPARGGRSLRTDSALAAVAVSGDGPVVTDPSDERSLFRWVPEAEREWVADANVALLAALGADAAEPPALLALGPRRGDKAYGKEERLFVAAAAAAAGLALENQSLRGGAAVEAGSIRDADAPAAECPRCGLVAPAASRPCACGVPLGSARIPAVLNGKFRVEARLGQGGMGVVYRAVDLVLDRPVALKTLPRVSAEAVARLRREARSMALVVHPNLASIHGAESWCGIPVLVVEYLAGGTLADHLKRPWSVVETLDLGCRLASGLAAMHARGLLHRDIKPSNIGFGAEATPKLLDFGLTGLIAGGPAPMALLDNLDPPEAATLATLRFAGTPLYLSPEAVRGAAPAPRQDLWALALVLFECLAGQHPWRGLVRTELLSHLEQGDIPDLRRVTPECPAAVAAFFTHALAPDPSRRPVTADAFQAALAGLHSDIGRSELHSTSL